MITGYHQKTFRHLTEKWTVILLRTFESLRVAGHKARNISALLQQVTLFITEEWHEEALACVMENGKLLKKCSDGPESLCGNTKSFGASEYLHTQTISHSWNPGKS